MTIRAAGVMRNAESAWTRRRAASTLVALFATCATHRTAIHAAIPSFSEYDAVQFKRLPTAVMGVPSSLPASAAEGLRVVQGELTRAALLVESGSFEDVRQLLRSPLFSTFLGYSPGVRGNVANMRPAAALAQASATSEPLMELLLDLKRLDDFCLSNRVIVFNDEDLEQIKTLMANPTQTPENRFDVNEVRGLLADARQHLADAQAALR